MYSKRTWLVVALWAALAGPVPAHAADLVGRQVDLTYDFGNTSGTLSAVVGPGAEFVLDGAPGANIVATIDVTADTITLTHSRPTRLGPLFPTISDDSLALSFPNLPGGSITDIQLTDDPMPEWFSGLSFSGSSVTLTQELPDAGVNTQLKVWTIEFAAVARYVYEGSFFNQIFNEDVPMFGGIPGTYTNADFVRGFLEISPPLPPDMPLTDVSGQIVLYSLEDGRNTLTEANSMLTAVMSTDSSGVPIGWNVIAETPLPAAQFESGFAISTLADPQFGSQQDRGVIVQCIFFDPGLGCLNLTDSGTASPSLGTWTTPEPPAPTVPLAGTPAVASLAIAMTGTGSWLLRRRRRS